MVNRGLIATKCPPACIAPKTEFERRPSRERRHRRASTASLPWNAISRAAWLRDCRRSWARRPQREGRDFVAAICHAIADWRQALTKRRSGTRSAGRVRPFYQKNSCGHDICSEHARRRRGWMTECEEQVLPALDAGIGICLRKISHDVGRAFDAAAIAHARRVGDSGRTMRRPIEETPA